MIFYNINGMPTQTPVEGAFWITKGPIDYVFKENDNTLEIETEAYLLRSQVAVKVFGSLEVYHQNLPFTSIWLSQAGIDSDIKISKEDFEKLAVNADEMTIRFLYYYDVIALIGALQNAVQEVKHLVGDFYRELNENSFMLAPEPFEPTMTVFASGLLVTRIFSIVNHIFISLYSQLDFIAKICYEIENMDDQYNSFKKLRSSKILFGDRKNLSLNGLQNSLFELSENIKIIESLRNEIVHNSSFENIPKVFQNFSDGKMVEKFIYLPDFDNGIIKSSKSRKRFFDGEIKLNEILPELVFDFWKRMNVTLNALRTNVK
jgi:hypothetical protein